MMPRKPDPLAPYNAKRDFARTAEPEGKTGQSGGNTFIVQKHAATRLHWDFRLEVDGKDLTALPNIERKERLEAMLANAQAFTIGDAKTLAERSASTALKGRGFAAQSLPAH